MVSWHSETDFSAAATALVAEMAADPVGDVSLSAYESARLVRLVPWLAGHGQRLRYLLDSQLPDGRWPGPGNYALVPTLSAVEALLAALLDQDPTDHAPADTELAAAVLSGMRALAEWLRPRRPLSVPDTVAVELLVPALIDQINAHWARLDGTSNPRAPIPRPVAALPLPPGLDTRLVHRLRAALSERNGIPAKISHSLEAFGDDAARASFVRPVAGVVACSPAATAAWLGTGADAVTGGASADYLATVQARAGGPVPVCAPIPVFERSWVLAAFASAGVPGSVPDALIAELADTVGPDGASAGSGLAPDADTTSTVLYALARAGRPRSAECLWSYRVGDHFASFPDERTVSTSTNAHVLRALGTCANGSAEHRGAIAALSAWLCAQQQDDGSWADKWHASPYYATSCCVAALAEFGGDAATAAIGAAVDWVLANQRADGAWGRWQATVEETAYAVRILLDANAHADTEVDAEGDTAADTAVARGAAFLLRYGPGAQHPPLWHDKDLYTPIRVVRAEVLAALHLACRHPRIGPLLADPDFLGPATIPHQTTAQEHARSVEPPTERSCRGAQ